MSSIPDACLIRHTIVRVLPVTKEASSPKEISKPKTQLSAKSGPYSVCKGCNGSVKTPIYEQVTKITWHIQCFASGTETSEEAVDIGGMEGVTIHWNILICHAMEIGIERMGVGNVYTRPTVQIPHSHPENILTPGHQGGLPFQSKKKCSEWVKKIGKTRKWRYQTATLNVLLKICRANSLPFEISKTAPAVYSAAPTSPVIIKILSNISCQRQTERKKQLT